MEESDEFSLEVRLPSSAYFDGRTHGWSRPCSGDAADCTGGEQSNPKCCGPSLHGLLSNLFPPNARLHYRVSRQVTHGRVEWQGFITSASLAQG